MVSMQRVLSAVLIGAILVLPFVGHTAAQASNTPVQTSEGLGTPKTAQDAPVPTLSVHELPDAPVQHVRETIIVAKKPVRTAKAKVQAPAKQYVCGGWQDSQVGGGYRACEWR